MQTQTLEQLILKLNSENMAALLLAVLTVHQPYNAHEIVSSIIKQQEENK